MEPFKDLIESLNFETSASGTLSFNVTMNDFPAIFKLECMYLRKYILGYSRNTINVNGIWLSLYVELAPLLYMQPSRRSQRTSAVHTLSIFTYGYIKHFWKDTGH